MPCRVRFPSCYNDLKSCIGSCCVVKSQSETEIEQLLDALRISLPLVQRLFPLDVMFALADSDKFIYYLPGSELDIRIQEGILGSAEWRDPKIAGHKRDG